MALDYQVSQKIVTPQLAALAVINFAVIKAVAA